MEPITRPLDAEQLLNQFCELNPALIRLHVAENILLFDQLKQAFSRNCNIELDDIKYQDSHGRAPLRSSVASFLNKSFRLTPALGANEISLFAGTRCAVEMATLGRFPPQPPTAKSDDLQFLVPTPCWQGFGWIYEDRLGGRIQPVPVPVKDWTLTRQAVEDAYKAGGSKARALVLTHPHNPLGVNYAPELLEEIFEWVLTKTPMDIVSDEIYAHCQRRPLHQSTFRSALSFDLAKRYPRRVHVAWGFAKDFGVSGFRVGVLASRDKELHQRTKIVSLAGFSPMTSSNDWFLRKLFRQSGNRTIAEMMMGYLPSLLNRRFEVVHRALAEAKIPYYESSDAAQFAWLDLRRWLGKKCPEKVDALGLETIGLEQTGMLDVLRIDERERRLLDCLAAKAAVQLLPGGTLSAPEPGFFRLCFTATDERTVLLAIRRIGAVVQAMT